MQHNKHPSLWAGMSAFITQQFYGELCRSPRNDTLSTPSGLEGSSGSSGFVCRGVAGAVRLPPMAETQRQPFDSNPNLSQIMLDLACLLITQEIFPQSAVVTDTPLLRKFPCETNILRDIGANL